MTTNTASVRDKAPANSCCELSTMPRMVRLENVHRRPFLGRAEGVRQSLARRTIFKITRMEVPEMLLFQYADDTSLLSRRYRPHTVMMTLQLAADELANWLTKWRVAVNGQKSSTLIMSRHFRKPEGRHASLLS